MTPKLQAVRDALHRMDKAPSFSFGHDEARKDLMRAAAFSEPAKQMEGALP